MPVLFLHLKRQNSTRNISSAYNVFLHCSFPLLSSKLDILSQTLHHAREHDQNPRQADHTQRCTRTALSRSWHKNRQQKFGLQTKTNSSLPFCNTDFVQKSSTLLSSVVEQVERSTIHTRNTTSNLNKNAWIVTQLPISI